MNSAADIWEKVIEILLQEGLTQTTINSFFRPCKAVSMDASHLYLYTDSPFSRNMIEGRFGEQLNSVLREIFSGDFYFSFVEEENAMQPAGAKSANTFIDNGEYTFDNFIVGSSNTYAHAAARAVASGQQRGYNPLFIYGNSGLGKTHLLYAIYHEIALRHPEYNIVYVKGETFTNELINAIQTGRNVEFREKYRSSHVLLIDDIQFISGKVGTQEEFFHTFNTLYEANRQIVFTSDRPPNEISRLEDRLRTRFESGLLADIQPPDYETRMAIIKNKTMQMNSLLPEDVSRYIAENMTSNVRQIEGAVKCVTARQDLLGKTITLDVAKDALKDLIDHSPSRPTPEMIIDETARFFGLTSEDIIGKSRTRDVTTPRQIAMYIIRVREKYSLPVMGKIFNRDHTTILYGTEQVEAGIKKDPEFAKIVRDIETNIYSNQ